MAISSVVEGAVDQAVVMRICEDYEIPLGPVYIQGGKDQLDENLARYNYAAKRAFWIVLRDLDDDASCPVMLRKKLLPHTSKGMIFRIATRSVESWLLADQNALAAFLSINADKITMSPENLPSPKQYLINLARRSRKKAVVTGMVPRLGSNATEGPEYTSILTEFVFYNWNPERAQYNALSLKSCLARLIDLRAKVTAQDRSIKDKF